MRLPGMISFGGGYPAPSTFAFERMTVDLVGGDRLTIEGEAMYAAMQYGPTPGAPALVAELQRWHAHRHGLFPEDVLVLTGSQEGLYLVADALLDEGDEVVVTEPTYPGALACWRSFTQRFLSIPTDAQGMRVDVLEAELSARAARGLALPALIYAIPNGDNPGGKTLPESRRRALAALAVRYDIPLVEDDPYELVLMDERPPLPSLQSLAPEHVLRLDSFSKILCPGLRLGYATGPAQLIGAMTLHKQASALHSSAIAQAVLTALLQADGPEGLLRRIDESVAFYRGNRDAMVDAARRHLPSDVSFTVPDSGMFLWFTLPEGFDAERMLKGDGRELGVLMVHGAAFSTQGELKNACRASYSMVTPEQLEEGMRRFAEVIRRERARVSS